MTYKIYKKFKFDAAHRILGHFGKCANLHGHTYEVILELSSESLNNMQVVVDYYNLKEFKDYIDNNFDHALIIAENDKELMALSRNMKTKTIIIEHSTSEFLAKFFFKKAKEIYNEVSSVEVKETQATGAIYYE